MEEKLKEAWFWEYCKECKHQAVNEDEEPCNECLNHPGVEDSHKPYNFESK